MNELRDRAKAAGFDLYSAGNGVALPKDFHRPGTLGHDYYRDVLRRFKNATSSSQFESIADDLAEELMKASGKLK